MSAYSVYSLRVAVTAIFLCAATANAEIYKRVAEDGDVTYSNEPPSGATQRQPLSPRAAEAPAVKAESAIAPAEPTAVKAESATSTVEPAIAKTEPVLVTPEPALAQPEPTVISVPQPRMLVQPEPVTLLLRDSGAARREVEGPPPRVIPRSTHTGAVQDPCLTSADPKCHERNKDRYHPYLGYAPGSGQSTGSSSGAGAVGAIGETVPEPPSAVIPPARRGAQALPPGSTFMTPASVPPRSNAGR